MLKAAAAIIALLFTPSQAFPTQPGSCNSPQPFGAAHLRDGDFFGGTALSTFDIEVIIGGVSLVEGEVFNIPLNTNLSVELRANGAAYRGFLLKLESDFDTRGFFIRGAPDDNVRDDFGLCETLNSGALAHRENSEKTSIMGNIFLESETELTGLLLEVTVAIENGVRSEWYQSAFSISTAPALEPPATTIAATTVATPDATTAATGGFDEWFDDLAPRFVGTNLRRCFLREGTPPPVGNRCSRTPKTCFFGNQDCSGTTYPDTRCFCDGITWSCGESACPLSPTATFQ